jgi:hypothetical protein
MDQYLELKSISILFAPAVVFLFLAIFMRRKEAIKLALGMLVVLIPFGVWCYWMGQSRESERKLSTSEGIAIRNMIGALTPLVPTLPSSDETDLAVRGKCTILDVKAGRKSGIQQFLPRDVIANLSDSEFTIFLVLPTKQERIGWYGSDMFLLLEAERTQWLPSAAKKIEAYRVSQDVGVFSWPQGKPLCRRSFSVAPPPRIWTYEVEGRRLIHTNEGKPPALPISHAFKVDDRAVVLGDPTRVIADPTPEVTRWIANLLRKGGHAIPLKIDTSQEDWEEQQRQLKMLHELERPSRR